MIGVLVLVTSVGVIGALETRDSPDETADISMAVDQTISASQSEVRDAVRDATTAAAQEPITSAEQTADTPVGEAIAESADETGNSVFHEYVRLRVYLEAERNLADVGQRIDESTTTRASLPDAAYSKESLKEAIGRVQLQKGIDDSNNLEVGSVEAQVEEVTVEAFRDGAKVAEREETVTVAVSSTTFTLHENVTNYEEKLQNGDLTGDGFGNELGMRLYTLAWAKAGFERYDGAPSPVATTKGFDSIIENKEVEVLSNGAIFAIQREEFNAQDPRATRTMANAYLCLTHKWSKALDKSWVPNSFEDVTKYLCTAGGLVLGGPTGDNMPESLGDLIPTAGGPNAARPDPTNVDNPDNAIEIHIGEFSYPAMQNTIGEDISWAHVEEEYGINAEEEFEDTDEYDSMPPNADETGVEGEPAPDAIQSYRQAIDNVYSGSASISLDSGGQDTDEPDASDVSEPDGSGWSQDGSGSLVVDDSTVEVDPEDVTKAYESAGASWTGIDLYTVEAEVTNTYRYKVTYERNCDYDDEEPCEHEPEYSEPEDVTYTIQATITGQHSTDAGVEVRDIDTRFESGGSPNPDEYEPLNLKELPQQALKRLVTNVDGSNYDDAGQIAADIESGISGSSVRSAGDLYDQVRKSGSTGDIDLGPEQPPGTDPTGPPGGEDPETNEDHLGDLLAEEVQESHEYVVDEVGSVTVTPLEMANGDPFEELRNRLDDVEEDVIYEDVSGSYSNGPDLARAEARRIYMENTRAWIDEIDERREQGLDNADDSMPDVDLGSALGFASDVLNAKPGFSTDPPESDASINTAYFDEVTYKVRGSPTYLTKGPVMRQTVPAVRPAGEPPEDVENTVYSTFASRNAVPVPNPGFPLVPWPGYWYASVNVWEVNTKGEYPRFEVTARTDDPASTKPVTYVREQKPVFLEVNGLERRAGTVEPIRFDNTIPVGIVMPGPQVSLKGSLGVGDREKPSSSPTKHELSECTGAWDYVGPGYNPMASPDMAVSGTGTGCGNKANDNPGTIGGAGGEGIELITEIQDDDSVTRGIADYIGDTAEDELYETCVPGEEEDDSLVGPRGGSGLPGAPSQSIAPMDLRLDDDDDDDEQEHEGCLDDKMTVTFIDVGTGASTFIRAPNGETMLIDAGSITSLSDDEDRILDVIEERQPDPECNCADGNTINHVVVTHHHEDHVKYIDDVADEYDVGEWHDSGVETDGLADDVDGLGVSEIDTLDEGEDITMGEVEVTVLNSHDSEVTGCSDDGEDCNALVLKVEHMGSDEGTFLLMSDVRTDVKEQIRRDDDKNIGDTDVLQVAHHGVSSAHDWDGPGGDEEAGEEDLDGPLVEDLEDLRAAVISNEDDDTGRDDRRHPDKQVLCSLDDADVPTFWTDKHGTVTFTIKDEQDISMPGGKITDPEYLITLSSHIDGNTCDGFSPARIDPTGVVSTLAKG
jgi:beta-lactamase superfamily II metal-dependent hydrolase